MSADVAAAPPEINSVTLVGRVTSQPDERTMPSGDVITTFRIVVRRGRTAMTVGSKQVSDWVECSVWAAEPRRAVADWQVGDVVEVLGALRRRFLRGQPGRASVVEVEVFAGQRLKCS